MVDAGSDDLQSPIDNSFDSVDLSDEELHKVEVISAAAGMKASAAGLKRTKNAW